MNNYGLVSIITPSYNCGDFIAETIRSVLAQTYTLWEMIIVDDSSTDATIKRVEPFLKDPRIRFIRNAGNKGAAYTRNRALREAKGRWIAFLDADDLWKPEKLERQLQFMQQNACSFSYTQYTETNQFSHDLGVLVSGPSRITKRGMYRYCWPGCLTVMYDAERIGLVQIADIRKNNDYAMWLKVAEKAECHLLPKPLAVYRRREGSISNHTYLSLVRWHYLLFRQALSFSPAKALFMTARNLFFGVCKKLFYVKKL